MPRGGRKRLNLGKAGVVRRPARPFPLSGGDNVGPGLMPEAGGEPHAGSEGADGTDDDSPPEGPEPVPPDEDEVEWARTVDESSGKEYYWSRVSGETRWDKPTELVDLDHRREQYRLQKRLFDEARAKREMRARIRRERAEKERRDAEEKRRRDAEMQQNMSSFMEAIQAASAKQKADSGSVGDAVGSHGGGSGGDGDNNDDDDDDEVVKMIKKKKRQNKRKKPRWRRVLDKASGKHYYWDKETRQTTWERPADFQDPKATAVAVSTTSKDYAGAAAQTPPSSLVVKALLAGVRAALIDMKAGSGTGLDGISAEGADDMASISAPVPRHTRARVELEIREKDFREGLVNAAVTVRRLKELARSLSDSPTATLSPQEKPNASPPLKSLPADNPIAVPSRARPKRPRPETEVGVSAEPVGAAPHRRRKGRLIRAKKEVLGLVDRWNAATAERASAREGEESQQADARARVEAWKREQIASGAHKTNVNFISLSGNAPWKKALGTDQGGLDVNGDW